MNNTCSSTGNLQSDPRRFEAEYDWTAIPPSTAIIESLAEIRGLNPIEMDTLHPVIELDAIDSLLTRDCENDLQVVFTVTGFRVTLTTGGLVKTRQEEAGREGGPLDDSPRVERRE